MGIPRPDSNGPRRLRIRVCAVAILVATAQSALAHPTDSELRAAREERKRCEAEVAAAARIDPVQLGTSEQELQAAVAGLRIEAERGAAAAKELKRWTRTASGDVAQVQYELFDDRIYRIRWQLAKRFERPVLDELIGRARKCFGRPEYDQTFEAEPGSSAATLRRIVWNHDERRIELRQLHPLRGGPVFLSVSAAPTLRELGTAGLAPFPEPARSAPWWQRSLEPPKPVEPEESAALGDAFVQLLAQLDH